MDNTVYCASEKIIGDTTYIVEYTKGANAKETVSEKLKKLILNSLNALPEVSLKTNMPVPDAGAAS